MRADEYLKKRYGTLAVLVDRTGLNIKTMRKVWNGEGGSIFARLLEVFGDDFKEPEVEYSIPEICVGKAREVRRLGVGTVKVYDVRFTIDKRRFLAEMPHKPNGFLEVLDYRDLSGEIPQGMLEYFKKLKGEEKC